MICIEFLIEKLSQSSMKLTNNFLTKKSAIHIYDERCVIERICMIYNLIHNKLIIIDSIVLKFF